MINYQEDFQKTLDIYNELKYDLAYTFIYSPREGTPAASLEDTISSKEKENRLHTLNELVNKYANEANQKYLNNTYKVLIEGPSEKNNKLMGYTETMKLVNIEGDSKYIGEIVNVKITEAKTWSLEGVIDGD